MKRHFGLAGFVAIYTVYTLLAFQLPLYRHAFSATDATTMSGISNLATLTGLQLLLLVFLLSLLALFGRWVLKGAAALLLVVNAAALYYMLTYNMEIDRTMIGNIYNTDSGEAGGLIHPALWLWVIPLGVFPALLILRMPLRLPRLLWRLLVPVGAFAALVGLILAASVTWPWFDANGSRLGARVLPWAYIANTARYFEKRFRENREIIALPDASFGRALPQGQRQIVVLVIGESARAQNFSFYGYGRDTNAESRAAGFQALPISDACATYTTAGVACILSYKGRAAGEFSSDEPLPTFLQRHGIATTVRLNNTGLPPLTVDSLSRAADLKDLCREGPCAEGVSDAMLLAGLPSIFADQSKPRQFVLLHITGSHGPAYAKKYPPAFAQFTPVCETVQVQDCSTQDLINTYDNTIAYTDHLLAELAKMLEAQGDGAQATILYVPDHGESLGEAGLYLHGTPKSFAPAEQMQVPFLVWANPALRAANPGFDPAAPIAAQDAVFHSVLGAFGLSGGPYDPKRDIFNAKAGAP